ncbi:MAG: translin family protein [Candidatus Thermoplasmatota archaeon]|nr:translin family protein [Candidatus Thermoplasmatota archaeon]
MSEIENLKNIVEDIDERLEDKDTVRELVMKSSRAVRRISKTVIQDIHQGKETRENLQEAVKEVSKIKSIIEDHPELYHSGFLRNGFQEFAEAHILWSIYNEEEPKSPEELDITPSSYVLGMADVVGELRRMILDELTEGNIERAQELHQKMEKIKNMLMGFDYPNAILPIKNKQDVARNLVEKTRGDITNSTRNERLREKMDEVMEELD